MASAKQWYCLVSAVSGTAARAVPRHVQISRNVICVCIRRGWDAAPSHSSWFLHLFSWVGFAQRAPSTCSCPWEHWGREEESWVKPCKCCGQKLNIPGITAGEKDVGKIMQISSEVFNCGEAQCPWKVSPCRLWWVWPVRKPKGGESSQPVATYLLKSPKRWGRSLRVNSVNDCVIVLLEGRGEEACYAQNLKFVCIFHKLSPCSQMWWYWEALGRIRAGKLSTVRCLFRAVLREKHLKQEM